jgi:phosphate transport system permease protein
MATQQFVPLTQTSATFRRRRATSKVMSALLFVTVLAAVIPLFWLLWAVTARGLPALSIDFFTQLEPMSFRERGGGYLAGIVGTLYMTGIASLMSIPLGLAAAVYLTENPRGRYAKVVRFFTDVMTGVPSVFVGLAVFAILVSGAGLGLGFGTLAGATSLAIIMLPIVVRSSEEMLRLVPVDLKNASIGLGARQWQTTFKVTLPAAAPGLTTGCILAVARGAGETAPLILTALGAREVVLALTGRAQADIGLLMLNGFRQPFEPGIERAWAGGFALIAIMLVLSIAARLIASRSKI